MRKQRKDTVLMEGEGACIIVEVDDAESGPVLTFLNELQTTKANEFNKILALLKRVAAVGPQNIRNEQRVKRLENNLYEFKSHQVRIFWTYGTSIGTRRTVVLLDGVVKKQNKHKPQDMNRARQHIARRQKEGKS